MKIELLVEWMGNRKGAILDLVEQAAQDLIRRKIAKSYKEKDHRKRNVGKA